jgi:uncharacterized protein (DUF2141 family)
MPSRRLRIKFSLACIILFFAGVSLSPPTRAQSGGPGTLIVKITGLHSGKGQVRIAVFNSAETWLGEHPVYSSTIKVDGQTVTWTINDVPYGDYGIAAFHDENSNGKMDRNLVGVPKEPYGFSNNLTVILRAPRWEKAKFPIRNPTTEISIEVN